MRVAIPLEQGQVAHHLGHCPTYLIADLNNGAVTAATEVRNPRHGPGGPPPVFLARLGVNQVVGWGAPPHVLDILARLNVKVTLGARGEARQVLEHFAAGTLHVTDDGISLECGGCGDDHDHDHDHE